MRPTFLLLALFSWCAVTASLRAGDNTNRDLNPANAIIIYAWNEHDEGGWIQSTLGADGKPDASRIQALEKVLKSSMLKAESSKE